MTVTLTADQAEIAAGALARLERHLSAEIRDGYPSGPLRAALLEELRHVGDVRATIEEQTAALDTYPSRGTPADQGAWSARAET